MPPESRFASNQKPPIHEDGGLRGTTSFHPASGCSSRPRNYEAHAVSGVPAPFYLPREDPGAFFGVRPGDVRRVALWRLSAAGRSFSDQRFRPTLPGPGSYAIVPEF